MSAIFLPRRWRHQPQGAVEIDPKWDARAALLLNGSSFTDPASRQIFTGGGTTVVNRFGRVRKFTGSQNIDLGTTSLNGIDLYADGVKSFSVVSRSRTNSSSSTGTIVARAGTSSQRHFQSYYAGEYQFRLRSDAQAPGWFDQDGKWHTHTVSVDGATVQAFGDRRAPYAGYVGVGSEETTQRILIGARSNGLTFPMTGEIEYVYFFAKALTYDQHLALEENPYQVFRAPSNRIWFDVGGGAPAAIEGDVVAEESGADTLAATGSVVVAGSLAAAEAGADTFAATGGAVAAGTLAASETGADALAGTGKVLVAGSLAATEAGADTTAATGAVLVAGTLSAAETGADTFSASGAGQAAGTLAAVESGSDTITIAGKVVISGALSASEAGSDTWAATGAVRISGSFSASESGTDTFSSTGQQPAVTGALAASEIGVDGFAAVGIVPAIGSFDLLEAGHDSLTGVGQIIVAGVLGAVESGQDTFIATPAGSISGVMAAIEAADTFAATGHGRAPHGARRAGDRGYATQTTMRRPQVQTMRRPRQTG